MTQASPTDLIDRLPHGEEFRFVDEVIEIDPEVQGTGLWRPQGNEPFFAGHFPGRPIVPGVLIGEALAQMAGLVGLASDGGASRGGMLAQIDLRLRRPVEPPAEITLYAKVIRNLGPLAQFDVKATCHDKPVATGTLTLAIAAEEPEPC